MPKILIRRAVAADFPTLLAIDQASFPPETAYDEAELSYFMSQKGSETLVLEEDKNIAAFLVMIIYTRKASLVTLDVKADKRRRGYASRLLVESERILRQHGVEVYELQVDVQNQAAIALYRTHGFQVGRLHRMYYADGHDAWQMIKKLPPTFAG